MKQFFLILLTAVILLIPVNANAAEFPSMTIIVSNPPDNLEMTITFPNETSVDAVGLSKVTKAWEAYYRFYWGFVPPDMSDYNAVITLVSDDGTFEITFPQSIKKHYDGYYTLNYVNQTITEGQTISRIASLVGLRVGLTLIIEGLILFLFGYRKKSTWVIFLITNLITQGVLNITLNNLENWAYASFVLMFFEIIIFFVEMLTYIFLLKEKSIIRAAFYALAANVASFILGGILISYLPI